MPEESKATLERAYKEIEALSAFGGGALFRRALATLLWEQDSERDLEPAVRCPIPNSQSPTPATTEPLSFDAFAKELRSEQGRRTVALDPVESLALLLIDFYTGKATTIEYRDERDDTDVFDSADRVARDFIRNNCPLISVTWAAAKDKREVIDALRAMAANLESDNSQKADLTPPPINVLRAIDCRNKRTESRPPKWKVNREIIVQKVRTVQQCKYKDHCCWNSAWTEYGDWETVIVWRNTDNVDNPPMLNPDPFSPVPWDHRMPLIPEDLDVNISSGFGWRRGTDEKPDFHGGVDFAVPAGTEVFASRDGLISHVAPDHPKGASGLIVRDSATSNTFRGYWHIVPSPGLTDGQSVKRGQLIGTVSGNTPEIHLHHSRHDVPSGNWFDRRDRNAVNPLP
jgi:hypothetical protein